MARQNHVLKAIATLLRSLGDDDYVALANRGLLRRARKDLEGDLQVSLAETAEASATLRVGEQQVTLTRDGPGAARCSCPAPGVCRHILVACLRLPELAGEDLEPTPPAEDAVAAELAELTEDRLKKWAGAEAYRKGAGLVARARDGFEVVLGETIVVKAARLELECRYLAGAGLDGVISSAPPRQRKAHVVAATLALWQHQGRSVQLPGQGVERDVTGAPRSRSEVVASVRSLLEASMDAGLSHLSRDRKQRFRELSMAAQGVKLYRLASALKAAGDDVGLLLERSARTDTEQLLDRLARLHALCEALGNAAPSWPAELVGYARTHYDEVDALQLAALGAYVWRTASGYHGLTLLFLEQEQGEVLSWSDVRPEAQSAGFDPVRRYAESSPWRRGGELRLQSRHHFELTKARRNADGRLGGSDETGVTLGESVTPGSLLPCPRLFDDWSRLREYAASASAIGLRRASPLRDVVLLEPAGWGQREFDDVEQVFRWWIEDKSGTLWPLCLDFSPLNGPAIDFLEKLKPGRRRTLIVGILARTPQLHVYPVSLITETGPRTGIHNLTLDSPSRKSPWWKRLVKRHAARFRIPSLGSDDAPAPEQTAVTPLGARLAALNDFLLARSELGTRHLTETERSTCHALRDELERAGLSQLSKALRLAPGGEQRLSRSILAARYLSLLHLEAETAAGLPQG